MQTIKDLLAEKEMDTVKEFPNGMKFVQERTKIEYERKRRNYYEKETRTKTTGTNNSKTTDSPLLLQREYDKLRCTGED